MDQSFGNKNCIMISNYAKPLSHIQYNTVPNTTPLNKFFYLNMFTLLGVSHKNQICSSKNNRSKAEKVEKKEKRQ